MFIKKVVTINAKQFKMVNANAEFDEIAPDGISRTTVLEFFASIDLSAQRLKAIAAERANTIHNKTFIANSMENVNSCCVIASVKPIAAKGKAKTV